MPRPALRWAFLLAITMLSGSDGRAVQSSALVASYRAPSELTLHEPVIVEVELRNASAEILRLDLGFNRQTGFSIRVKSPDGVVHTPQVQAHDVGTVGRLSIPPGGLVSHRLLLNDWLAVDQVGNYDVTIQLNQPIRTDSGAVIDAPPPEQFRLTVGARNAVVLEQLCREMADVVLTSDRAADRLEAARVLSYITDPVMLPFVAEIMAATDEEDAILVHALARVNTDRARDMLTGLAAAGKPERTALARNALRRFPTIR